MILIFIFTIIIVLLSVVDGYFYVPNFMSNLPYKNAMATSTRNGNSLVLFGGENGTNAYTNDLYQLTQTSESFNWQILNQNNPPPGTSYSQSVVTNNNNMYLLGGMTNATNNQLAPFQNYQYSFDSNTWTASPNNSIIMTNTTNFPTNRKLHTATFDNQNSIYIYAGALNDTIIFGDFFKFDILTQQYTSLPSDNVRRFGHTASLLR